MKNLKVTVNGISYNVKVEEVDEESFSSSEKEDKNLTCKDGEDANIRESVSQGEAVEAPMSGTIVSVDAENGQHVKKGDILLVLEAMKMENEIVAPRDAVVLKVNTQKGASVNAGDALIFLK